MHPPPPDALKLTEAFKDSNPAYLKLIPHEGCARAQRARNTSWKHMETLFLQECGVETSYSTLRRFLADTDRLRAAWAAAPSDPAPSPTPDLAREEPPDTAERDASHARIVDLEAELVEREEQLVAQQREIAELRQRTLAFETERDALAAQAQTFDDWPSAPGAKRRGFVLGLLAGLVLAALALAAWLWFAQTPLRGLAAFAEASALIPMPGAGWLAALRPHRTFLYVEAAVIAAGLLCGIGALRAGALALLVWLTYSAMLHRQYRSLLDSALPHRPRQHVPAPCPKGLPMIRAAPFRSRPAPAGRPRDRAGGRYLHQRRTGLRPRPPAPPPISRAPCTQTRNAPA